MTDAELAALNRTLIGLGLRPLRAPARMRPHAHPRAEPSPCRRAVVAAAERGVLVRHFNAKLEVR